MLYPPLEHLVKREEAVRALIYPKSKRNSTACLKHTFQLMAGMSKRYKMGKHVLQRGTSLISEDKTKLMNVVSRFT